MPEEFLYFLWMSRLFHQSQLTSCGGERIRIISVGFQNFLSGPDFTQCKVQINNLTWIGQVEMHVNASDWYKHNHHHDPAYSNVILHVVWNYDQDVLDLNNNIIPVLELKGRVSHTTLARFKQLQSNLNPIPCHDLIGNVEDIKVSIWLDRLLVNRLERKIVEVKKIWENCQYDWNQTLFVLVARALGFKFNQEPMEMLANQLSYTTLIRKVNSRKSIEAILFGVSGLLHAPFQNPYINELREEFSYYQKMLHLSTQKMAMWKFGGLRPSNFPTIRISQLADFVQKRVSMSEILDGVNTIKFLKLFELEASKYWEEHYTFSTKSNKKSPKKLGVNGTNVLMINAIAPLLFLFGEQSKKPENRDQAIGILEKMAPEFNGIIKKWKKIGVTPSSAAQSQSLIELYQIFCLSKKCLTCGIGSQILKKNYDRKS